MALVRDGSVEGNDPVVEDEPFAVTPVPIIPEAATGSSGLMRADSAQEQSGYDSKKAIGKAIEQVIARGPFG